MPLTSKGTKILRKMKKKYGAKKGKEVFYASEKKGAIAGVHNPTNKDVSNYVKRHGKK